ncbi:HesA/MoeB/ThiF family protein [Dactylosporangium sp. CA-233914]|uniref:HesA/MoeB/ThiF family protein n=1 Tax=Dactylosporangium sp. CA-233914 TaxID=3239934 RepID=UPI003D8A3261
MTAERYARLRMIGWWDADRVAGARAIVAGAGALGNEVVKNLLLLGWGSIVVVDRDHIEESNLSRSALFRSDDVGRPKAEVVAERAAGMNPDCDVTALTGDLRAVLSAGMVARSDVVFGCLDNVVGRIALSQLAGQTGRVFIDGGLSTWEGSVQVFASDPEAPCYVCGLTSADLQDLTLRRSCLAYQRRADEHGGVATTPTLSSIIGALMVQQAVKLIHQGEHTMTISLGHELRVDTADDRFWRTELTRDANCPLHPGPPTTLDSASLSWEMSWAAIVEHWRTVLAEADVVLQLPVRLLCGWSCSDCGARDSGVRVHVEDAPITCQTCGSEVVPTVVRHVNGQEPWATTSPRESGLAALSRLQAQAVSRQVTFELAGGAGTQWGT